MSHEIENKNEFEDDKIKEIPTDQFSHSYLLLDVSDLDPSDIRNILSKPTLLANIGDDALIRIYQKQLDILISLHRLALRHNEFTEVYKVLFFRLMTELSLTRAKNGTERYLQAFYYEGIQQPKGGFSLLLDKLKRKKKEESILEKLKELEGDDV